MIPFAVLFCLLLKLIDGGSWKTLIHHYSHSDIGFVDLWYNSTYNGAEHYRNVEIDNWNISSPTTIAFGPYSATYGGYLMLQYLQTQGATFELSSWLTTERILDRLSSMSILQRKEEVLFISNYSPSQPESYDKVWIGHLYSLPLGHVTFLTYDGFPQYLWKNTTHYNFGLERVLLKEGSVTMPAPDYFLHVTLNITEPVYVHAVAVNVSSMNITGCTYTINYAVTNNHTLAGFSEPCNGVRHNISVVRAATITFIFSTTVTAVDYKIYISAWPLIIAPSLRVMAYYEDPVVTTEAEMESVTSTTQETTSTQTTDVEIITTNMPYETTSDPVTITEDEQTTGLDKTTSVPMTIQTEIELTTNNTTSEAQGTTDMCVCTCENLRSTENWNALTETEQQQYITESVNNITKELLLNTSTLSSTIREKISVEDKRTSSAVVGYFGVAFIATVLSLLILPDIIQVGFYLHQLITNKLPGAEKMK